mmetsp:Transcript_56235/g.119573  ORF Transcript_56235/g.119573 Transcript_56235/m.119573 type:complete len:210 (+) Transcript_56235:83-712(+)
MRVRAYFRGMPSPDSITSRAIGRVVLPCRAPHRSDDCLQGRTSSSGHPNSYPPQKVKSDALRGRRGAAHPPPLLFAPRSRPRRRPGRRTPGSRIGGATRSRRDTRTPPGRRTPRGDSRTRRTRTREDGTRRPRRRRGTRTAPSVPSRRRRTTGTSRSGIPPPGSRGARPRSASSTRRPAPRTPGRRVRRRRRRPRWSRRRRGRRRRGEP